MALTRRSLIGRGALLVASGFLAPSFVTRTAMALDGNSTLLGRVSLDPSTPMSRLWSDPRVLITPHISSACDQDRHGAINLFCDNLRAYLEGGPLRNVIDWERGY